MPKKNGEKWAWQKEWDRKRVRRKKPQLQEVPTIDLPHFLTPEVDPVVQVRVLELHGVLRVHEAGTLCIMRASDVEFVRKAEEDFMRAQGMLRRLLDERGRR